MQAFTSVKNRARRYRNLHNARGAHPRETWERALDSEVGFWRGWFATKGGDWPEDYPCRLDPDSVLQDWITRWLGGMGPVVRFLDCGAGPLTKVGKTWPGHDLRITAVDALAAEYDKLLAEAGVVPPVRTQACETEHLTSMFAPASFDVAYALNTLDHSYDPLACIREMAAVVRPGGVVLLQHYPNEAENENYDGLHQWNFDWINGDGVVWRPGTSWQLSAVLDGTGEVSGEKAGGMVTIPARKTG